MSKKKIKVVVILTVIIIILAALAGGIVYLFNNYIIPNSRYKDAKKAIEQKNYTEAYALLTSIENSEKAEKLLKKFEYKLISVKDSDGKPYELYEYDEDGNCLTSSSFTYESGKSTEEKHTYKYDEDGNPEKDTYLLLSNGKEESKIITKCAYDDYGRCFRKKNSGESYDYTYDEMGNILSEKYTTPSYKTVTFFEYEKGVLVREKIYSSDICKGDRFLEYFYNDSGDLIKIEKTYYDFNGFKVTSDTLEYDEKHQLVKKTVGKECVYTYKYDKDNNCIIEKCESLNGSKSVTTQFGYDELGGLKTKTVTSSEENQAENTVTFVYDYKVFYNPEKRVSEVDIDGEAGSDIQTGISENELNKIYAPKIEEYRGASKLSAKEFLIKYPNDQSINASAFNKIGNNGRLAYALYDIDKNGVKELIIGIGDTIIDLYTVSNGEILKLFKDCSFCKPNNIHILSNGILLYEGLDSTNSGSFIKHYITKDKNGAIIVDSVGSKYYDNNTNKEHKNILSKADYDKICNIMLKASVKDELNWQKIS